MVFCDPDDNELLALEVIHHYVEILDRYFGNVSFLLTLLVVLSCNMFNLNWLIRCASWISSSTSTRLVPLLVELRLILRQAYYILDELVISGELQETSKKSILRVCASQDAMMEENKDKDGERVDRPGRT